MQDTSTKPGIFELRIQVRPDDIDQLGHVNNIVYVRWVQEAAVAHWNTLSTPEEQKHLAWVIIRHEIDYKRPAFLDDSIIARTWVGAANGLSFERNTEILRESDRKLLAKARTLWCPINAETMRPTEPGPDVRRRFSTNPDSAYPPTSDIL